MLCFGAAENCSGYRTCGQCLDQPGCGWCTDPSNTGKGQCIEGSYRGPFQTSVPAPSTLPGLPAIPQPALNASMCPSEAKYNWSFIHCPGRRHSAFALSMCIIAGNLPNATSRLKVRISPLLLCCFYFNLSFASPPLQLNAYLVLFLLK